MNFITTIRKNILRKKQINKALIQLIATLEWELTCEDNTTIWFNDDTFDMKPLMFYKVEKLYDYLIKHCSFDLDKLYNVHIYKEKIEVERNNVAVGLEYFTKEKMKRLKKWAKSLVKEVKSRGRVTVVDYPFMETHFFSFEDMARYVKHFLPKTVNIETNKETMTIAI